MDHAQCKNKALAGTLQFYASLTFSITAQWSASDKRVSNVCLGCICEVASGCNISVGCEITVGTQCGPFAITWSYWADAGKPTLNNDLSSSNSGELLSVFIKNVF